MAERGRAAKWFALAAVVLLVVVLLYGGDGGSKDKPATTAAVAATAGDVEGEIRQRLADESIDVPVFTVEDVTDDSFTVVMDVYVDAEAIDSVRQMCGIAGIPMLPRRMWIVAKSGEFLGSDTSGGCRYARVIGGTG